MKRYTFYSILFLALSLNAGPVVGSTPENDPVIAAMQTEINRNMKGLHIANMAGPCYIDFQVSDVNVLSVQATRGSLVMSNKSQYRAGIPTVLVGDYTINNENIAAGYYNQRATNIPFGANDEVIRTAIWKVLDGKYKTAAEEYSNKLSAISQMELPEEERNIPDFQPMKASEQILPLAPLKYDRKEMEQYVTAASKVLKEYPELNASQVNLNAISTDVRYCNSEGTVCRYPSNLIILTIYTRSQTKDGQELVQNKYLTYNSFDEIPSQKALETICREEGELMRQKLNSKMIRESYVGPVLFEGEAVADLLMRNLVHMNGILAQRRAIATSALRLTDGNELESMINKKVISRNLTLTSMSGTSEYKGKKLFGYYETDAQGVKPDKELVLIENGVLRNMLTTRTPSRLFRESNGHARSSIGGTDVTLVPGVLRLSGKALESEKEMRNKLIAAAKEEDYEYAYIVRKMQGESPSELIRIHVKDGTEELIRGGAIKDMSLRSFKRISGVSDQEEVYNRIINDAKSTFIVPSALLFDEVEIIKDTNLPLKKNYLLEKPL